MANLEDRLNILEGLVGRLLYEVNQLRDDVHLPPHLWPVGRTPPLPPEDHPFDTSVVSSNPLNPQPRPHPDWLLVQHQKCGGPGVYLTQRVSGVQVANRDVVRILPRTIDPEGGYWITEPYRAPMSSDVVLCATCAQPIDIWTNRDLDYRPWLDNEIGQPMYPKSQYLSASPDIFEQREREALARHEEALRLDAAEQVKYQQYQEDQLLKLKQQAQTLREQTTSGARTPSLPPLPF
jgi:hypothetical protein